MATIKPLLAIPFLAFPSLLHGQDLDKAEVRIPYGELKQLLARAEPAPKPKPVTPKPALLSADLKLTVENDSPVIQATFRITSFSDDAALVPLIAGDIALHQQEPVDAPVVVDGNSLCLAVNQPGTRTLQLRLLPIVSKDGFSISLPPCPSTIFETGDLPPDHSVVLSQANREEVLASGIIRPLPHSGQELSIRMLDTRETHEALRPPEPSTWTWQHEALVSPSDDGLIYQIISRATAASGSGVDALLQLPPEAQDVTVIGEDLVSHSKTREANRSLGLSLTWKTRGILDRQLMVSYRMPLLPLDRKWSLQSPGGDDTRTRFIIADSPFFSYAADGLTGPLSPKSLPASLAETLHGNTCHLLETSNKFELAVSPIPVAATAEGVVTDSQWALKIEPDGAMLATGTLTIEHDAQLGFVFDTPTGMKLLSCEVADKPVSPVDLGEGKLKVTLDPSKEKSKLTCSFTGHTEALDPVEGTMKLSLPKIPLFIHSLVWSLDLPAGYMAETHGNLIRAAGTTASPPSRISLRKNLCRDERPEIQVFYQRADLNR